MIDPADVHRMEQGIAAMRELAAMLRGYMVALVDEGFTEEHAFRLVVAYQAVLLPRSTTDDG